MSKLKRAIWNASIVTGLMLGFVACDDELNTIGSDILGADQLNDRIKKQEFDVVAFNELLGPIQTNNFSSMLLGSYDDPIYGRTDYSFVTQVSIPTSSPSFGINPVLDSVVMNVPYYTSLLEIDGDDRTYEIDSLYGSNRFHLQVYENNYFLSDIDPLNIEEAAVYYSDLGATIDAQKGNLLYENTSFIPDPLEIILEEENEAGETVETERLTPRLRVVLGKTAAANATAEQLAQLTYWENTILNQAGTSNLQSNSNFQDYFRGLYFKVNSILADGSLVHVDISGATIDLYLKINIQDINDIDDDGDVDEFNVVDSKFTLQFGANRVNLIDSSLINQSVIADIQAANDDVNGEERLYLKGGEGSMVLIDLFGPDLDMNGEADALTQVIENEWLINEASLTFYVDRSAVTEGDADPERIILYNFDDNAILADFSLNPSGEALNSNIAHLGRLSRVDTDDESSSKEIYKIRITEHVNNIINGDIENVRLALAVTQNVNLISNGAIKNPNVADKVLTGAAISHEGTIIYGNIVSDPADQDKRLKLDIYYTETNQ